MNNFLNLLRYAAILLICSMCLFPFVILMILSLNTPKRVFYEGNMFIPDFYFLNYIEGWFKSNIGRAMVNSLIITFLTLIIIVLLCSMAAYTIARFNYKFNKIIFGIFISCMMIPGIINTVPLYSLMIKLKAINSLWGMAVVCAAIAMPQAIFVFQGYIKSLPKEVEESARIDGCSWFTTFWHIVFPLLKPSISAVVILNGFGIYNNYSQAVFYLQSSEKHNVPQALSVYFQQFAGAKWNLMAATAVIAIVPVIIIFLIFQKSLMAGLTEGAVKG
ncbi:carbohydrate ABC transporter permease [Kineothrix sp. MB12-C1]|uniref:carbohydrate ABC transporter permease n=1 Tax=Kineothrix sp. MB12-C1 TaxID=3070215 RepID=UPI0027D1EADE|nr:carbohydrate ABC transporter permease [Kineothrix sp. MB12-C1]WMC93684.1 carbohydrate ABC transporter permease [Kineothrix sp. MB12-C1]